MIKLKKLIKDSNIFKNHIYQICDKHRIKILYTTNKNNICHHINKKTIEICHVKNEISYSWALHEIGHVLNNLNDDPFDFDNEIQAWKWAKSNALTWNPKMQKDMVESLYTYLPSGP